ncbi:MAG: flagellar biosynthetic protein FliO [Rhodospirillales bacterium]|nr:flagellar biosynthetic protein FliO [Rhodospirillales bacterium]
MDLADYLRFFFALLFVLGLIGALALTARKMGYGIRPTMGGVKKKRLSLVEVMPIDGKRRLVLVRRDNVEHLILMSATLETIVESGIPAPGDDPREGNNKESGPGPAATTKHEKAGGA